MCIAVVLIARDRTADFFFWCVPTEVQGDSCLGFSHAQHG